MTSCVGTAETNLAMYPILSSWRQHPLVVDHPTRLLVPEQSGRWLRPSSASPSPDTAVAEADIAAPIMRL